MFKMTIKPGCVTCGRCSYILPGWPEQHKVGGLLISSRHIGEHGESINKVIDSCPLGLIELNEIVERRPSQAAKAL